ncbi:hypothetical protein C8R46DRAFT_1231318 [Mycena filopes]|nr:hypothetical protein C8R46DRAFT_1231318 [Mycena filopes]
MALLVGSQLNRLDIHEIVVCRGNLLLLSKRFHALCLIAPELWSAVDVHVRNAGSWNEDRPSTLLSLEDLDRLLLLSKDRPLHIAFSIPISIEPGTPALLLFQRVLLETHRLQSLCLLAASTCDYSFLCPHAIFTRWPVLRDAPLLRVAWVNRESTVRPCPVPHPAVQVRLPELSYLKAMFPATILGPATLPATAAIVPTILPHLTNLGIDYQSSDLWAKVLDSCVSLQTLRYGANNALNRFFPVPLSMPSLRCLRIYRMTCMPPVTAPNLVDLSVVDPLTGLTATEFSRIVGAKTGHVALRSLDLFVNPVLNDDLNAILDRCPALRDLRLCSDRRGELRTSAYRAVRDRMQTSYLRLGRVGLDKAVFSNTPPHNTWAERARWAFDALCRIAVVRINSSVEIASHRTIFRVEVLGCKGYSPHSISRFLQDNNFDDNLIAAEAYEMIHGKAVPQVYTIILAFREPGAALQAESRGVRQGGSIRKVVKFHRVWDEAANTFV